MGMVKRKKRGPMSEEAKKKISDAKKGTTYYKGDKKYMKEQLSKRASVNKYALKWTRKKVNDQLDEMIEVIEKDKKIKTITSITAAVKLYRNWFLEVKSNFKDDKEINNKIDYICNVAEDRLLNTGLDGKTNPQLTIFALKSYHDRIEKQHIVAKSDIDYNGQIEINIVESTKNIKNHNPKKKKK